jgi:hypothetical protein
MSPELQIQILEPFLNALTFKCHQDYTALKSHWWIYGMITLVTLHIMGHVKTWAMNSTFAMAHVVWITHYNLAFPVNYVLTEPSSHSTSWKGWVVMLLQRGWKKKKKKKEAGFIWGPVILACCQNQWDPQKSPNESGMY